MKSLFSKLMDIMETIRKIVVSGFLLIFLLIFFSVLFSSKPEVPEHAVLVIEPEGRLVEQLVRPSADAFPFAIPDPNQVVVSDVVQALRLARNDPKIEMVRLELAKMQPAPLAKLQDLRRAIDDFKQSGKQVVVFGSAFSQSQYYLAASADKLFLHPMGLIELTGFALYQNYFKSALGKLDIDIHLFRAGEYKSAAEPLVRDDMSEAARTANRAWLTTLWELYKTDVATMRSIKAERIQAVLDSPIRFLSEHNGDFAVLMKTEGLVDELADRHEVEDFIVDRLGRKSRDDVAMIGYKAYLRATDMELPEVPSQNLIGVVQACGPIINGEQPTGTAGGDTIAGLLRDAREDERIKAVVLRVDSPGGSALASEVIRKEVARIREAGKPVVVSMGSVAASGGYWISAPADEIWAQPTTITGSIGVFGVIVGVHRGLEDIGIHTDGLGTTTIAGGLRSDRPLHPELKKAFQMGVDDTYKKFIAHVSSGRGMESTRVEQLAQGRVWSGVDAKKLGLVDQLGTLNAAVASAAKRAGVANDYRKVSVEKKIDFAEFFVENMIRDLESYFGGSVVKKIASYTVVKSWLDGLKGLDLYIRFNDPRQVYAYSELPY